MDTNLDSCLRPKTLEDFVGQQQLKKMLSLTMEAAKIQHRTMEHLLFEGPPGTGKTSLASIVANDMGVELRRMHAPTLDKPMDLVNVLRRVKEGDVLFIDEIHRLSPKAAEILFPAMEEYILTIPPSSKGGISLLDDMDDEDFSDRPMTLPLNPFTLIGATTRVGLLSDPLLDRFGLKFHMNYYSLNDLVLIVKSTAKTLKVKIDTTGATVLAARARKTPRVAINLVKRARDYVTVKKIDKITALVAAEIMQWMKIDNQGLDDSDRRYLTLLIEQYKGKPVGIENIAMALGEELDTLTETVEPYLIQQGLIIRTSKGRQVTELAYKAVSKDLPDMR